jgi:mycoredoxin
MMEPNGSEGTMEPITVYGTTWCGDCHRARQVLDRVGARYRWIDVEEDPRAEAEAIRLNHGNRRVPTIVFPDGSVLIEPSAGELEAKLAT